MFPLLQKLIPSINEGYHTPAINSVPAVNKEVSGPGAIEDL